MKELAQNSYQLDDKPRGIYLVLGGQLKLIRSGPAYREHIVHLAERNAVFGEAAIFLQIGGGITGALSIGPMHAHIATPGPACRATQADHSGAPAASR